MVEVKVSGKLDGSSLKPSLGGFAMWGMLRP